MSNVLTQRLRVWVSTGCLCLAFGLCAAQENKTVIGPSNPDLYNGAQALLAGDAEEGVRLTLLGLQNASSTRDRVTGLANLCAGYILLEQLDTALSYCGQVLEKNDRLWRAYSNRALAYLKMERYSEAEQDLQKAESLAPNSRKVKTVRAMLLDAVDPVAPQIVIDERRQPADDDGD
jgi:tetratricopeptide (TPR) repeat protein